MTKNPSGDLKPLAKHRATQEGGTETAENVDDDAIDDEDATPSVRLVVETHAPSSSSVTSAFDPAGCDFDVVVIIRFFHRLP